MDPASTAPEFFGSLAERYDSLIRRAVPRYEEMSTRLLDYLPESPGRILELGSGVGALTRRLADRFPTARITTVDAAPEMLDATRNQLGDRADRVTFVEARFEEVRFAPESFDLITSCISLHHVEDKAALYRSLRSWLTPGGRFALADQCRGATDEIHAVNWRRWIEFCRAPGHCTDEEIAELLEHAEAHDYYTPVREHFALLRDAGFDADSLDCVWRNWIWAILLADTPQRGG